MSHPSTSDELTVKGKSVQKRFNPFKSVLKKAIYGRQRITRMISGTFSAPKSSLINDNSGARLGTMEDEEDDHREVSQLEVGILRTFSPLMVHRKIHMSKMNAKLQPSCQTHFGAVLFADISGFTRLANLLSVEQLQIHISNYFSMLFECVEQFGGDILKICGDAIMIMWPLESKAADSSRDQMAACALTACLCGRELLLSCGSYCTYHGDTEINLSLHCGVGVADVTCYWVGKLSRWEFLITGDTLKQIASTEPEAKSGEIVISPETYKLVKQHLPATSTPHGNYLLTTEIITLSQQNYVDIDFDAYPKVPFKSLLAINRSNNDHRVLGPINGLSDHPTLQFDKMRRMATNLLGMYEKSDPASLTLLAAHQRMGKGLKCYIHQSARPRLRQMDHTKEFEMAELREIVTIFFNIIGLEDDFKLKRLEMIQKVMSIIVESHVLYGGTLRQFVVDDKGCVAIGALGVPHHTYEDNGVRAVSIANMVRSKIQSMGKNCGIGISAGRAFCGLVGSANRREYAMMGSSVNLAARLMCSCSIGGIIVDERVRAISCELLLFESKGTIIAKGYEDPVPIFEYKHSFRDFVTPGKSSESYGDKLIVGRKEELDSLRSSLKDYVDGTPGFEHQFHFLEGEEGIGKSSIAKQLAKEAIESGIDVVFVTGSESSSNIEHWLISNILDQFMSNHEFNIKKLKEKAELERESSSDNSSCPSPLESRATWSLRKSAFTTFEPLPVQESLSYLRSRSKTVRFRDWLMHLSSIGGTGSPSLTSSSATSTASPSPRSPPSPAVTSVSESRPQSVGSGISANTNFGELKMIHGYRTLDLVHLVQDIFHDSCSLTEGTSVSSTPASASAPLHFDPRVKDLLLKALIVRTLRAALELSRTVLVVDNLQWCDEQSTQILIDLITSSDSGFGIFCYRKTPNSMETEQKTFVTLRGISQCITLSSLRSTEVSELAYGIMGQPSRSCLNRERLSRIITRTQGIPGLVESLVTALKDETDRGLNPNIEDIRIPGQQSIVQKFDALDVSLQLLLKTAAAVGLTFSLAALREIYATLALQALLSQNNCSAALVERGRSISCEQSNSMSSHKLEGLSSAITIPPTTFPPPPVPVPVPVPALNTSSKAGSLKMLLIPRISFNVGTASASPASQIDNAISPRLPAFSSVSSTPRSRSRSPINLARQSLTQDMFVKNRLEYDIERLVALRMLSPCEFHGVKTSTKSSSRDTEKSSDHRKNGEKDIIASERDAPEIGIHAWQWLDARGIRRRGWAAISVRKKTDVAKESCIAALSESGKVSTKSDPKSGDVNTSSSLSPRNLLNPATLSSSEIPVSGSGSEADTMKFFKFSHPSIQSTAYSLSLQLDRVPVHAATIEYLTSNFGLSPGVEEACLYHSLHLNEPGQKLSWLLKCAVSAKNTMRHGLFVQRATQVLSTLVKADQYSGELDDQFFATIERYMERQGVLRSGVRPTVYPYNFSNKKLPDWSSVEGKSGKNDSWLLTIGCILRDLVCAMVKMGEFRVVLPLHKLSEDILHNTVHREPRIKRKKDATAVGDGSRIDTMTTQSESGSELDMRAGNTGAQRLLNPADLNLDSDASSDISDVPSPVTDTMYLRSFLASNSMDSEKGNAGDSSLPQRSVRRSSTAKIFLDLPTNHSVTISNYSALLLDNTACVDHIFIVHILAYIRGYEALALWNILRGNPPLALQFINSAINALQRSESSCLVLYSLCFGRLLALKSLCCSMESQSQADGVKCLEEALMWVKKSKERAVWGCIQHFNGSILPQLPGLKDLHRADTGEWVVLVVSALGLCGVGKWKEGGKLFYAAQIELKEINDRASLFQIKLLHAWALFMAGDLLTFHTMMQSITSHTKQNEERFIGVSSGILLAIRFSLSCFYDAADTLITKVKVTGTPVTSPISTPKTPTPRGSIQLRNQSFSILSLSMNGPSQLGTTIFLRVSEAFLVSRRNASDLSIMDITILCAKMAIRTPCTYIGGMFLFFTALAALAVYEHTIASSDNSDSGSVISGQGEGDGEGQGDGGGGGGEGEGRRDEDGPKGLLEGIEGVLQTLDQLSMKHTVLLYMSRAMHARYYRAKGCLSEVIKFATLNTDESTGIDSCTPGSSSSISTSFSTSFTSSTSPTICIPHPAESLPLGSAYLRMEIALCQQALYDVSESIDRRNRRLSKIVSVAKESIELFAVYEANIEIELLRACISNTEDLRRELTAG